MSYPASRKYSYLGQFGLLIALVIGGLIIGTFASFIPLLGKIGLSSIMQSDSKKLMDDLLKPENASALRWMQFISTFFLLFFPAVCYASICHKKPFTHLGFKNKISINQIIIVGLIMMASLPLVDLLEQLTRMLPFAKETFAKFQGAEDEYNKQIAVIARMDSPLDYVISIIIVAFLPAVFEETLFRGALQNLLSRWTKMPILSIALAATIFSLVHFSYLGFLSRFVLGFILGWLYYRTGNIWLNIIGHFCNNAVALTALYVLTKPGQKLDAAQADQHFSIWSGIVSFVVVCALLVLFDQVSKKEIDNPGKEISIDDHEINPYLTDINNIGNPELN